MLFLLNFTSNWQKSNTKSLFVVFQKASNAVNNFDPDFTMEEAKLTPTDADLLKSMDQMQFKGFSFINPAYHMKK